MYRSELVRFPTAFNILQHQGKHLDCTPTHYFPSLTSTTDPSSPLCLTLPIPKSDSFYTLRRSHPLFSLLSSHPNSKPYISLSSSILQPQSLLDPSIHRSQDSRFLTFPRESSIVVANPVTWCLYWHVGGDRQPYVSSALDVAG